MLNVGQTSASAVGVGHMLLLLLLLLGLLAPAESADCGKGKYLASTGNCKKCARGRYQNVAGTAPECKFCGAGRYQDQTEQHSCKTCGLGKAHGKTGQLAGSACKKCVIGKHQNAEGQSACKDCPAYQHQDAEGQKWCKYCVKGRYRTDPAAFAASLSSDDACALCGWGTYKSEQTPPYQGGDPFSCTKCPVGTFSNTAGLKERNCKACADGQYGDEPGLGKCKLCSTLAASAHCAAGRFLQQDTCKSQWPGSCAPCGIGQFRSDLSWSACRACFKGQYQDKTGSSMCKSCGKGRYTDVTGTGSCKACPAGEFQQDTGGKACEVCAQGRFARQTGQSECKNCLAGRYHDVSVADPASSWDNLCKPCQNGKYQPTEAKTSCVGCGKGRYRSSQPAAEITSRACWLCPPGQFQNKGGQTSCNSCDAGQHAKRNSNPESGSTANCEKCPAGRSRSAVTAVPACAECGPRTQECTGMCSKDGGNAKGYCSKCNAANGRLGACCKQGASADPAECTSADIGLFLTGSYYECIIPSAQPFDCAACIAGHFQDGRGQETCKLCPEGQMSSDPPQVAAAEFDACQPCPLKKFQNEQGQPNCKSCPLGQMRDRNEAASSTLSKACKKCVNGRYQDKWDQDKCKPCPLGMFSNVTLMDRGAQACEMCEVGRYQDQEEQLECKDCPAGKYISHPKSDSCKTCVAGKHSPPGADVSRTTCLGKACSAGSYFDTPGQTSNVTCKVCPAGQFAGKPGRTSCILCPQGKYQTQPGADACRSCRNGKTTPADGHILASDCECNTAACCGPGFYKEDENAEKCTSCTPGYYQSQSGQTECNKCPVGKYAIEIESSFCQECEAGYVGTSIVTNTGPRHCVACPMGRHMSKQGQEGPCEPCVAGTFAQSEGLRDCARCEKGTMQPEPEQNRCEDCAPGRFAHFTGQTSCAACFLGQYQPDARQDECHDCNFGRFHNATASSTAAPELACVACPRGKFQSSTGNFQCKVCAAGQHGGTEPVTSEAHCESCARGQFAAKEGELTCKLCSKGTYGAAAGAANCAECAAGSAADSAGLSACTNCTAGRVAPSTRASECRACEAGRFQEKVGNTACLPCEKGHFSALGAANCSICGSGTFWRPPACQPCESCPAGAVRASCGGANGGVCISCSVGQFQNGQECTQCVAGMYQEESGKDRCFDCAATSCPRHAFRQGCGRAVQGFCSNYTTCSAGKFQSQAPTATSDRKCKQCEAGQYQDGLNTTSTKCKACDTKCKSGGTLRACGGTFKGFCLDCPSGKYLKGGVLCVGCQAGRWCVNGLSHPCGGANQYCPPNSSSPTAVNYAHYSVPEGPDEDVRQGERPCPLGYNCRRGVRTKCAAGRVCRLTEQRIFDITANGSQAIMVATAQQAPCKELEFAFNGTCVPCPAQGAKCTGGMIELVQDFWYDADHGSIGEFWWKRHEKKIDSAYNLYRCAPDSCAASDHCESDGAGGSVCNPGKAKCMDGRSGPLCAVCNKGYFATTTMGCKKCPEDSLDALGILGMLVFVAVLACGGYKAALVLQLRHPKMALAMKEKLPQIMKLCTGMYQILSSFGTVFHAVPWPHTFSAMSKGLSLLTLDIFAFPSLRCSSWGDSYYKRFDVHVGTMLAMSGLFVCLLAYAYSDRNHAIGQPLKPSTVWKFFLPFLFVIYPSISQTVILMLRCRDVDGKSYLLSDFALRCDTDQYSSHKAFAIFGVIIFPVGILLVFTAVVGYSRKKLPPDWWPHEAEVERDTAFIEYEERSQLSGVTDMLSEEQWCRQVWEQRMSKYNSMYSRFGFLFGAYTQKCWWFESVFTIYKLMMTVGILFVSDETPNKILFGMVGATTMMALSSFYQPFKHPDVLSINTMSQFVILLILFAAQYFLQNGNNSWLVTMLVIALTLAPLVASVILTLRLPKGADGSDATDGISATLTQRIKRRGRSRGGTHDSVSTRKLLRSAFGSARHRAASNWPASARSVDANGLAAVARAGGEASSALGASGGVRCSETGVLFHDVLGDSVESDEVGGGGDAATFSGANPLHTGRASVLESMRSKLRGNAARRSPPLSSRAQHGDHGSQLVLGGLGGGAAQSDGNGEVAAPSLTKHGNHGSQLVLGAMGAAARRRLSDDAGKIDGAASVVSGANTLPVHARVPSELVVSAVDEQKSRAEQSETVIF